MSPSRPSVRVPTLIALSPNPCEPLWAMDVKSVCGHLARLHDVGRVRGGCAMKL